MGLFGEPDKAIDRSRTTRADAIQHLNSIRKDTQGNYLISSRHYHAIWYLAPDGNIIWQLGGINGTVQRDEDVSFQYQHDAEWIEEGQLLRCVSPLRTSKFDRARCGCVARRRA